MSTEESKKFLEMVAPFLEFLDLIGWENQGTLVLWAG